MALNNEQSIHRAGEKIWELILGERESCRVKMEHERESMQAELRKAKAESERYRLQAERYKVEAEGLRAQLVKTKVRYNLTIVPIHDDSSSGNKITAKTNFNGTSPSKRKRKRFSTTITNPVPASLPPSNCNSLSITGLQQMSVDHQPIPTGTSPVRDSDGIHVTPKTATLALPYANTPGRSPSRRPDGADSWCYCGAGEYGLMVGCSGPRCSREWFHLPCAGLEEAPIGDWFCNECAPS